MVFPCGFGINEGVRLIRLSFGQSRHESMCWPERLVAVTDAKRSKYENGKENGTTELYDGELNSKMLDCHFTNRK